MKKSTLAAFGLALTVAGGAALASNTPPVQPAGSPEAHGGKHRMFEQTDSNKDGAINQEEWRSKGDAMFKERDTNGDGKISQDEMKAHHDQMREKFKAKREAHGDHPTPDGKPIAPDMKAPIMPAPAEGKPIPNAK